MDMRRLIALLEDEMPQTSGMQTKDTKKKYAKLAKELRPNNSHHKARSHLMNTTNSGQRGGEQGVTARMRECIDRLEWFSEPAADPKTSARDDGEARIAKRDVKVLGDAKKRARKAGDSGKLGPFSPTNTVKLWKRSSISPVSSIGL